MTHEKLNKMCCPFDKNELQLEIYREEMTQVFEGLFSCSFCRRYFPIISGIPIMVPDEYREHSFEQSFLDRWAHQLPPLQHDFRLEEVKVLNKYSF